MVGFLGGSLQSDIRSGGEYTVKLICGLQQSLLLCELAARCASAAGGDDTAIEAGFGQRK